MKKPVVGLLLVLGVCLTSCSKKQQTQNEKAAPAASNSTATNENRGGGAPAESTAAPNIQGVKTEMRNVLFHLTPRAAAHLQVLSGEVWPVGKNTLVVFDDKTSFEVRVSNGTISITPAALTDVMNSYVFAQKDAPLKDLAVSIDQGKLIIKGKLHSKGDIPFATAGTLSVNADGRIRVHTEKITALKIPVKGLMGLFGVDLANVVNTNKIAGIDTDKNDLMMDLGSLLPPPHIRGKLTGVRIEPNGIVTTYGDGGKSLPAREDPSYMAFAGSRVQFGRLVMDPSDLTVLDLDGKGTLEWDQDHYKEQLEAGYSKITPTFGLRAYAKNYSQLGRSAKAASGSAASGQ
ncbi:MAG TPA: hypothetical protein VMU53_03470 [Candidatus Sulfotelmatobacter sp.]|nr:hypothetical protein [Candidatus Sulfotelmatobacter sp.]